MTPREKAETLVVVVPLPGGLGLVTVAGSAVGCGFSARESVARATARALVVAIERDEFGSGSVRSADHCVVVSEIGTSLVWEVLLCGEDLPGAEPLAEAEARRGRIVARLARVLDPARCVECGCTGRCPWVTHGEVDSDAVPCASCSCRWCGGLTDAAAERIRAGLSTAGHASGRGVWDEPERLAALKAKGQRVADELGLTAAPAPVEEPTRPDPRERLRAALGAADRWPADHSEDCPHRDCADCGPGHVGEGCEADGASPCEPGTCYLAVDEELHAAARAVLDEPPLTRGDAVHAAVATRAATMGAVLRAFDVAAHAHKLPSGSFATLRRAIADVAPPLITSIEESAPEVTWDDSGPMFEVLDERRNVLCRRPAGHPDITEALRTEGQWVRPEPPPPDPGCNMHKDCKAADAEAAAAGKPRPPHCSSDDCEDCFPK